MPTVELNGERVTLPEGATAADAARAAGAVAETRGVALALDGEVLPRGSWQATALREGGRVEVLHAVQGG